MRKFLLSIIGGYVVSFTIGTAAEPTAEITPKEAVRLISLKANVPASAIEISFIVDGSAKCGEGFEVKHVRRVAAIQYVRDGPRSIRRLIFHDFFWNEYLGWFMWELRLERASDTVHIWSEIKGEIVN